MHVLHAKEPSWESPRYEFDSVRLYDSVDGTISVFEPPEVNSNAVSSVIMPDVVGSRSDVEVVDVSE